MGNLCLSNLVPSVDSLSPAVLSLRLKQVPLPHHLGDDEPINYKILIKFP